MPSKVSSPTRSVLTAMIVWTLSCVAIYFMLTRAFALTSGFAAMLLAFAALVSLPALVMGLTVGFGKVRRQGADDSQTLLAAGSRRDFLVVSAGFALASLLSLGGILAMDGGLFLAGSVLVVFAAVFAWLSTKRLRRITSGIHS
jgi:hypothetical protein